MSTTNVEYKTSKDNDESSSSTSKDQEKHWSIIELVISVLGIYGAFLTWAVLQERIATTSYGPDQRIFRGSLVINTVQSALASIVGYAYVIYRRKRAGEGMRPVFANKSATQGYAIVAAAQSLSSYFAYASLNYGVDYLTLLLAKSCKLLPLMALHLTVYRRRYPAYKYAVVGAITVGVALFSICHHSASDKASSSNSTAGAPSAIGATLLIAHLLLDGFYNSTQDNMFRKSGGAVTGPHMMCGLNLLSAILTSLALLSAPKTGQLAEAVDFISQHPRVLGDIILFGVCGALGQLFIFHTLERYGSIVLVTVTVTRKMVSMLLSVIWFNHTLTHGQWVGVLTVFVGISAEAYMKYREKKKKE